MKETATVEVPEQTVCGACAMLMVGAGFTMMVSFFGKPAQPLALGITVITTMPGLVVLFSKVNAGTFPTPDEGLLPVTLAVATVLHA